MKTQVVIIGAGPTGLSMAAQLIRHNIDFIILEKNLTTTHLSKAIVIQARTLEIFQELGIAEEALKRGAVTTNMNLFYKGRKRITVNLSGFGEGLSEFALALSLEQSKTERLLVEYLHANNKMVQWGCELVHFTQNNKEVIVTYKDQNGKEQKIEAGYLVGCDGSGSLVRHQLGFSFKGSTKPKLFYVADLVLNSPVINQYALYFFMVKKGFILFFPMEGAKHYRIVGVLPDHENNKEYQFSDIAPTIKKDVGVPVEFEELRWFSSYRVHSRKANSFMKARCFIAGDAAHIHTPAGGQGMNTGIQDAYNLAWKIAHIVRGEANEKLLKTYNDERLANATHLLKTTDRMFDIMSGVNPFWNALRLALLPVLFRLIANNKLVGRVIFPLISQIGIAYPDSDLTIKSSIGKVKAGDRMHYFVFSNGRNIFSYLADPAFKLLHFGIHSMDNSKYKSTRQNLQFHFFNEIPSQLFGNETEFYILLRPDNHISYIGKEIGKCYEFLDKIT